MIFVLHETEVFLVVALNGECLQIYFSTEETLFYRWTQTGWQRFITIRERFDRDQAYHKTVSLILQLTGDSLRDDPSYQGHNGQQSQADLQLNPHPS